MTETAQLTNWIADVLDVLHDEEQTGVVTKRVRHEVIELCSRFPVYEEG